MTAKEYLQQVYNLDCDVKIRLRMIADMRSMLYSIGLSSGSSSEKIQSTGDPDQLGRLLSEVDQEERKLYDQVICLVRKKKEIEARVDRVKDPRLRLLLFDRYILMRRWEEIISELHVDPSWIHKRGGLHGKALQAFREENADLCISD